MISADLPLFPYIAVEAMEKMKGDVVVPVVNGKFHTCAAIYEKKDIAHYVDKLNNGIYRLTEAIEGLTVTEVSHGKIARYDDMNGCFLNINTKDDLVKAENLVQINRKLGTLRARIDRMDETIIRILEKRSIIAATIGKRKLQSGLPLEDTERERAKLVALAGLSSLPLEFIESIYVKIFEFAKSVGQNAERGEPER
jgi:chorismate mutase